MVEGSLDKARRRIRVPDTVALHRLNRKEYAKRSTICSALDIDAATLLPQDDERDGFDNIASALQVSPSFLEQYMIAARTCGRAGHRQPNAAPAARPIHARALGHVSEVHVDGLPLGTRGGVCSEHYFPADGDYEFNIADMARGRFGSTTWSSRTRWS